MKIFAKKIFLIIAIALTCSQIFAIGSAEAYVSIRGYTRSDGTYVKPHVRSNPNGLKIDNYGYKPSQGIYNKTYGTRGSSWDTPTTITDPDYYTGKALYESNQSGSSYSISPSLPNTNTTVNNPPNSYVYGSTWYCNSGYKKAGDECQKIYNPPNSYIYGSSWYCNSGYKKIENSCEKIENPPNSYVWGSNWYCNSGYKKVGDSCDKINNPSNSYVWGSNWYCNSGYVRSGQTCVSQ